MTITKNQEGSKLKIVLEGRLDTNTAPSLEAEVKHSLEGVTDLTLDFAKLDYVSSAGLRAVLTIHKLMAKQGKMVICNVNSTVMEVFEMTGFTAFLSIQSM